MRSQHRGLAREAASRQWLVREIAEQAALMLVFAAETGSVRSGGDEGF
jgi:hypothetical protein